jgi:flagellar basal-body rod protein FlgB
VYVLGHKEKAMNVIDKVFGVSPQALTIRSQRFELISANLANADTPGYKAMDIDFAAALSKAQSEVAAPRRTHQMHMAIGGAAQELKYRVPTQAALDGNTVETEREHSAFMDNAIRYQASLNFLDSRIKSMMSALRGD